MEDLLLPLRESSSSMDSSRSRSWSSNESSSSASSERSIVGVDRHFEFAQESVTEAEADSVESKVNLVVDSTAAAAADGDDPKPVPLTPLWLPPKGE